MQHLGDRSGMAPGEIECKAGDGETLLASTDRVVDVFSSDVERTRIQKPRTTRM